jgi:hypothetical protein
MDVPDNLNDGPDPYEPKGSGAVRYFIVRGRGPFPHDMLRYDDAWALTGVDDPNVAGWKQPWRSVVCATSTRACPTARWQSFGWSVEITEKPPWLGGGEPESIDPEPNEITDVLL